MKIITGLRGVKAPVKGSVVTIGVFDGVHLGHKAIIRRTVDFARKAGLASVVITFDPHPAKIVKTLSGVPSLISLKHRARLIEELGADILLVVKFTRAFSKMPAERFVKDVLVGKFRVKRLCVGEDFCFGKDAAADMDTLRKLSARYGFKLTVIKQVRLSGRVISSSAIRELIAAGKLDQAKRLLGRPVSVLGTVVRGSGIARGLGCPTANVNPHHEVIPPRGVYAVKAFFGGKGFGSILNIGFRPTFYSSRDKEPTIEVHLFGFKGNLYNKDIEVYFVKKLRDEVRFRSESELARQIAKDMKTARRLLFHPGVEKILYKPA